MLSLKEFRNRFLVQQVTITTLKYFDCRSQLLLKYQYYRPSRSSRVHGAYFSRPTPTSFSNKLTSKCIVLLNESSHKRIQSRSRSSRSLQRLSPRHPSNNPYTPREILPIHCIRRSRKACSARTFTFMTAPGCRCVRPYAFLWYMMYRSFPRGFSTRCSLYAYFLDKVRTKFSGNLPARPGRVRRTVDRGGVKSLRTTATMCYACLGQVTGRRENTRQRK